MLYWPTVTEGLAYLEACDTAWARRNNPGWYAGTDEYEQRRRIAETWARDVLEAMKAGRGETDAATS